MKEIYQQTVEEVLKQVGSKELGLTSEQARKSREKCGWNELAEGKKKNIVQKYNIDINENYKLYLLYTVSYYLDKYNNQEKLHDQVFWLIDVWFDAFNDLVDKKRTNF